MMNTKIWGQILFKGERMMWPQQAQAQVHQQAQAHIKAQSL